MGGDGVRAIRREVNCRRPQDDMDDRGAMAHTAWVHLLLRCQRHDGAVVDWERMNSAIRTSVRKAIRDYSAYMHEVPISAYARFDLD